MHHIAQDAYRADAEAAARFLEGDREGVLAELERRMQEHARRMEFEAAAFYRDAIRALRDWTPTSRVVDPAGRSIDLVAHATGGGRTVLVVFLIRHGLFVDRREFVWDRPPGLEPSADTAVPVDEEWWTQVLTQFYLTVAQPPDEVWLPVALAERSELEAWLERHFGRPVRLRFPAELSEADRDRLEWVGHHARQLLQSAPEGEAADEYATLRALQHMLNLPTFPYRIEGFDISNIQGQWNVGGVVVFEGGRPKKSEYRRFRIRTVEGPDDYACMREAVYRRYAGSLRDRLPLPDLILIDGGKGQLHAALEALAQAGCSHIPAIALAKREEIIYVPTSPEPLRWPRHTPALRLLQHVRDEAHRWVISYYRRLHRRAELQLALTEVPGIGPRLARRLLEHFGSLDALRQARVEEVARVIGRRRAEALCAWLQKD
jgi:excinuclease ABC subunit C